MYHPAFAREFPGIELQNGRSENAATKRKIRLQLPDTVIKGGEATAGVIRTSLPFDQPVEVLLVYSGFWIRKLPQTVLFPARVKSVKFEIVTKSSMKLDVGSTVRVAAVIEGQTVASTRFNLRDSDRALKPTLQLPEDLVEGQVWLPDGSPAPPRFGRVTIKQKAEKDIRINLSSTHPITTIPSEIFIRARETYAEFELKCPLDQLITKGYQVKVSAQIPDTGAVGRASMLIREGSWSGISAFIPTRIPEGFNGTGQIRFTLPHAYPLWINFEASYDSSGLILPERIQLPAGATSIDFPVSVVDGVSDNNSDRSVSIRISTEDYHEIEKEIEIIDAAVSSPL